MPNGKLLDKCAHVCRIFFVYHDLFLLLHHHRHPALLLTPGVVHCRKRSVRFSDVWTGQYMTYAKARETGDVYTWGLNNYYQLGRLG